MRLQAAVSEFLTSKVEGVLVFLSVFVVFLGHAAAVEAPSSC